MIKNSCNLQCRGIFEKKTPFDQALLGHRHRICIHMSPSYNIQEKQVWGRRATCMALDSFHWGSTSLSFEILASFSWWPPTIQFLRKGTTKQEPRRRRGENGGEHVRLYTTVPSAFLLHACLHKRKKETFSKNTHFVF